MMKILPNVTILVSICIASLGLISYCFYRLKKHRKNFTDILDKSEIQFVNRLSLQSVVEWIDNVVGDELSKYDKLQVNILPNKATKEAFNGALKLPKKDMDRCILVLVNDDASKQVVKRKLVIPNSIADDLFTIKEDKIFILPIE